MELYRSSDDGKLYWADGTAARTAVNKSTGERVVLNNESGAWEPLDLKGLRLKASPERAAVLKDKVAGKGPTLVVDDEGKYSWLTPDGLKKARTAINKETGARKVFEETTQQWIPLAEGMAIPVKSAIKDAVLGAFSKTGEDVGNEVSAIARDANEGVVGAAGFGVDVVNNLMNNPLSLGFDSGGPVKALSDPKNRLLPQEIFGIDMPDWTVGGTFGEGTSEAVGDAYGGTQFNAGSDTPIMGTKMLREMTDQVGMTGGADPETWLGQTLGSAGRLAGGAMTGLGLLGLAGNGGRVSQFLTQQPGAQIGGAAGAGAAYEQLSDRAKRDPGFALSALLGGGALGAGSVSASRGGAFTPAQSNMKDFNALGVKPVVGAVGGYAGQSIDMLTRQAPLAAGIAREGAKNMMESLGKKADDISSRIGQGADPSIAGMRVKGDIDAFAQNGDEGLASWLKDNPRATVADAAKAPVGDIGFAAKATAIYERVLSAIDETVQFKMHNTLNVFRKKVAIVSKVDEKMRDDPEFAFWQKLIEDRKGFLPLGDMRRLRTWIGKINAQREGERTPTASLFRDLYAALKTDIYESIRWSDPAAARALKKADQFYAAGMKRVENSFTTIMSKRAKGEGVFAEILSAAKAVGGDVRKLWALRRSMPKGDWANVTSSVINFMGRRKGGKATEADQWSGESFLTAYTNMSPKARQVLFDAVGNEATRKELDALVRVLGRTRAAEELANSSNTGHIVGWAATVPAGIYVAPATTLLTLGFGVLGTAMLRLPLVVRAFAAGAQLGNNAGRWSKVVVRELASAAQKYPTYAGQIAQIIAGVEQIASEQQQPQAKE